MADLPEAPAFTAALEPAFVKPASRKPRRFIFS